MDQRKVYLAGPFFNEEQRATMTGIEKLCNETETDYFSPRLECLCPPNADEKQRLASFEANVDAIRDARFVLARIDDFDPGTMWEMGYAYAMGVETYAFTTVEDRGLNLMLAASGVKIIQGWKKLDLFLQGDMGVAIQWKKSII